MREDNLVDDGQLQQDNGPNYKSRLAQQFLSSEVADVIDWVRMQIHWRICRELSNIMWRNKKQQISNNSISFYRKNDLTLMWSYPKSLDKFDEMKMN